MKKTLSILSLVLLVLAASPAYAGIIPLPVGGVGSNILGEAFTRKDIPGGGGALSDAVIITNALLGMTLNTRATINGPEYYRSLNSFGTLPSAVTTGAVNTTTGGFQFASDVNGDWIVVTSHPYAYLVASYDGQNAGTEVWYIGGIAQGDTIYIPRYAYPSGTPRNLVDGQGIHQYQATGWQLLNPVPDGGTPVALLGLAMIGLGFVRRLKR
jgi:hypothetical protein